MLAIHGLYLELERRVDLDADRTMHILYNWALENDNAKTLSSLKRNFMLLSLTIQHVDSFLKSQYYGSYTRFTSSFTKYLPKIPNAPPSMTVAKSF
jgi:hypothetical protein